MMDAGFQLEGGTSAQKEFVLPATWDANSDNGLFTATYRHPNDLSVKFELQVWRSLCICLCNCVFNLVAVWHGGNLIQGLVVGNKFEVYISDDKEHTHSIELR
jgi:hypothetical protein